MTKCSICHGSGKTEKVYWRFQDNYYLKEKLPMEMISTGEMKDCPGCDGSGVSVAAKIKDGTYIKKSINLDEIYNQVIKDHPEEIKLIKSGKTKAIGRLIKAVLVASDNKADPKEANTKLLEMING